MFYILFKMPALSRRSFQFTIVGLIALFGSTMLVHAQVDQMINQEVWKQKFGVLDAQLNEQAPYIGWLVQDADGDGVSNGAEFIAGTNPFKKKPGDANFHPPSVMAGSNNMALAFPTVVGKFYTAEANASLVDTWNRKIIPGITGDGTTRTLIVPRNAGHFFRIAVSDQSSQGDQVSDWAKYLLGLSLNTALGAQSTYDHTSLAADLESQNLVTLTAPDAATTQPPDGATSASDLGVIRVTRSGFILLGDITVPILKSGSAVEGTDFSPLPNSVVFPAGVNSLDIRIVPLANAARTGSATVFLTAAAAESPAASGNYSLGTPSSAGVTIYPAANPAGTGLTANYYPGSSSTYSSTLNFSDLVASTYSYIRISTTSGTAVITYFGKPATPYVVGSQVPLQFTSGNLTATYNKTYPVVAPITSNSFTVNITGTTTPGSGTGNSMIGGFSPPVRRLAPVIDFLWGYGTPNGNNYINADNYSVTWDGWLSPTTAGSYVFQLDADDKARVSIDTGGGLVQILENGWDTPATNAYKMSAPVALSIPAGPANRYPIRVEFSKTTGNARCKFQWQLNGGSFVTLPPANVFTNNISSTAGWNGVYYNNASFTPPAAHAETDADLTAGNGGDWLTGSPDPLVFHNNFSGRWTGQILPQYSGKYFFVAKADDGCKLWVNGQLIIDQWTGATGQERTGSIDLVANGLYDIKMEYYEAIGSAEAHLSWYSNDQAKQIIPTGRLFPTAAGSPAITSATNVITLLGVSTPFTLTVTSSNGGTVTASGLPPWLILVNGVLSGIPAAAGIYQFTLTTTNASGSSSVVMTLEVQAAGGQLTRDIWSSGVAGALLSQVPWTSVPSTSNTVVTAEDTSSYATNTGERLRGYFTAPVTGNYYFWIAASNAAELWISNNSEPVNKVLRATVTGAGTAPRTWDAQPNQRSPWLSIVAGRRYYLEALHNTGASGAGNHLSLAWFVDPSGTTANPIPNNSPPATAMVGGILPTFVLSPWDYPPTTAVPGTLYVTALQGVAGLRGITATGGAFLRVSGSSAVLHLNCDGLSSGITSRKIYNSLGTVLFDATAQDKNYPALKTSDHGYVWNMQASDLAALNNGTVYLGIATVNHPTGEVAGTFGKIAGSQIAPSATAPPAWTDLHATSDAANSRFLTQTTFGPSPTDMANVKASGYRSWMESQFSAPTTHNVPYILANLTADPNNPYSDTLMFNSWWRNAVTAPDQLRQRAAFALSEILVVSDTGPLNSNGRVLADYYDTLLDSCFGNFRDILKQVTLSPAMGVYLDMRGNTLGNIQTGLHPNENYAREILQLYSVGLYRKWADGSLVLDSSGAAVPTYDQNVITGMARVFTGWNWGQPLLGTGRLPTSFNAAANYLDPMVLVPAQHELGSKILLDNVVLPPATDIDPASSLVDAIPISIQTTDLINGPGSPVTTSIYNRYDLNGLKDLEATLNNIMTHSAVGPTVCRQLIQRLVTSHPKPEYVQRVVRAFNGEMNVDGVASGVRGDMRDVFRAILLDYEARSTDSAADSKFGKQREPLLRVTGPARSFPAPTFPNSSYTQSGSGTLLVTTPTAHRLINGDSVRLADFVDTGGASARVPTTQGYTIGSVTPNSFIVNNNGTSSLTYTVSGSTALIDPTGVSKGDQVYVKFTSGGLAGAGYDGIYTVGTPSGTKFTVPLASIPTNGTGGSCLVPKLTSGYVVTGSAGTQSIRIQTTGNHNLMTADSVQLDFLLTNAPIPATNGVYAVTGILGPNSFTVALPATPVITNGSQGASSVIVYPLKGSQWIRSGAVTVELSTWGIGSTPGNLNQTPLNSPSVFNFFYPDYQYPGAMSAAGMTTPEFQLTNDSNIMNLTNLITQGTLTNNTGNTDGYVTFFGANAITLDLAPYMTASQTSNNAVPALVSTLGVLLTGGNLTDATTTTLGNYVINNLPYTTPTATQMRDRVRAIVHQIVISAEYAIQK